jgi:hypothetical protein
MSFLDNLERRFGFIAIPGLLRYVAILSALAFLLYKLDPSFFQLINLEPALVFRGQVWRVVTYIFIPATADLFRLPDWLNAAFYVLFLWWMGNGLEQAWGPFKLTMFFLLGMMGTTAAAFVFGVGFSNVMLIASLFFAFARFYPDVVIYFAYVLPLKIKWIAWGSAAFLLWKFLLGSAPFRGAVIAALANYLIFFGRDIVHAARHRQEVATRRKRFELQSRGEEEALHRCTTCGATEISDPSLEFRVARDGEEYCLAHLPRPANAAV